MIFVNHLVGNGLRRFLNRQARSRSSLGGRFPPRWVMTNRAATVRERFRARDKTAFPRMAVDRREGVTNERRFGQLRGIGYDR